MRGYVYVMTNRGLDGLVKVGFSTRDPRQRAAELAGTGVPYPFEVHYEAMLDDPESTEQRLHRRLREAGVHAEKEFFRMTPSDAVHEVRASLQAIGTPILFEPRRTYLCSTCGRWSFSVGCCSAVSLSAKVVNGSSDVAKWSNSSIAALMSFSKDHATLGLALGLVGVNAISILGDRVALVFYLAGALLDDPASQAEAARLLASGDGIDRDQEQSYVWGMLAHSHPNADAHSRVGGLIWADAHKLSQEAKERADVKVAAWIAAHRINPSA